MARDEYCITYRYVEPKLPPHAATDWPDSVDWPGIEVCIALRASLPEPFPCPEFDSYLTPRNPNDAVYKTFYAPTLAESEALARAAANAVETRLAAIFAARETRLARRAETIARAHAHVSTVKAPQDITLSEDDEATK